METFLRVHVPTLLLTLGVVGLTAPLWAVRLIGAAISIGFTCFFGLKSFRAHALMVGAVASLIGLLLFLILELDLPFTGSVDDGPSAMNAVIHEFPHYAD